MDVATLPCRCGRTAVRQATNRVSTRTATPVDMRGHYRRFQEASAELDHAATTHEAATGQTVAPPNLWQSAQERAQQMHARGEAPPLLAKE
jgi:hypothetical protein